MLLIKKRPDGTFYKIRAGEIFDARDKHAGVEIETGDVPVRAYRDTPLRLHRVCGKIGLFEYW